MTSDAERNAFLVRLCHHRWSAETAAAVAQTEGCRFVELQHRLQVSPDSLRAALAALFHLDLVRRNPGYGHPLRPEYLPTAAGLRARPSLDRLIRLLNELGVKEIALCKWSLPLVDAAAGERRRFGELQEALAGITPRALAKAVKDLVAAGLIRREVLDGYPPIPVYSTTPEGSRVAQALRRVWMSIRPGAGPGRAGRSA